MHTETIIEFIRIFDKLINILVKHDLKEYYFVYFFFRLHIYIDLDYHLITIMVSPLTPTSQEHTIIARVRKRIFFFFFYNVKTEILVLYLPSVRPVRLRIS